MAEDADQCGTGAGDRWIHHQRQDVRRAGARLLPRWEAAVRLTHTERIYAGAARTTLPEDEAAANQRMSVCESARGTRRSLGTGLDGSEDERLPLAQTRTGRAVRTC